MIFSPKYAIDQGWVKGIKNDCQIQPNAIEFTLDNLFSISDKPFIAFDDEDGKTQKRHRGGDVVLSTDHRNDEGRQTFWLAPGVYDCTSDVYVTLPEDVALLLIVRSTFNRNGIFLTSGLYDSGYEGHIGCAIHNWVGAAEIGVGTRLGQAMFVRAESEGQYAGGYNHSEGSHWTA